MKMRRIVLLAIAAAALTAPAFAQGKPPRVQVALFPNSHLFASGGETANQPKFRTYTPGGAVRVNLTPHVGLEGDLSGSRGSVQGLGPFGTIKSPAMLAAMGNLVVTLVPRGRVQPYATAGVGSIRLFKRLALGMAHDELLASANAGGGATIAFNGWGLRADYRYVGMESIEQDPSTFVGAPTRHAHRLSLGLVLGARR